MAYRENTPYEISRVDRLVGLVIVVALVLAAVAVVRHFREATPHQETLDYYTLLKRSYGIAKGADIRISGISIGQVGAIALQQNGYVRARIQIADKYRVFVTRGSHLEIASAMGLEAIVDITKVNLITNRESSDILPPGSLIRTAEPVDLADTFSTAEVAKIAANVKTILANLAELSQTMTGNQALITSSLDNVNQVTLQVRGAMQSLPAIADSATRGFDAWERAGTDLYTVIDEVSDDVQRVAQNARAASGRMDAALAELQELTMQLKEITVHMRKGAEQIPGILTESRDLIERFDQLTDQISQHWLMGGAPTKKPPYTPSIHALDEPLPGAPPAR